MSGVSLTVLGWSVALSLALANGLLLLRDGRRRTDLNEALHELRRPLQAIALAAGPGIGAAGIRESSIRLAGAALERLDREVNGGGRERWVREEIPCEALSRSAVGRWRARALRAERELGLRWRAGAAVVVGDPSELEQALDNLIVNAIEHGGPEIVVEGDRNRRGLRLTVADSGGEPAPRLRGDAFSIAVSRLTGRRRRGHGLAVVRRVAARHGGRFVIEHGRAGSRAVLELPVLDADTAPAG